MNYNWLEVSAKTKEGNRCRAHVMVLRRQLFVVFGLREETGAVLSFTALLLCTWVHTHTSYTHTHIQMRSVAEGFYLSSVPSSIEVKADCSNKGVPAFKHVYSSARSLQREEELLLLCLICFYQLKGKYAVCKSHQRPFYLLSLWYWPF